MDLCYIRFLKRCSKKEYGVIKSVSDTTVFKHIKNVDILCQGGGVHLPVRGLRGVRSAGRPGSLLHPSTRGQGLSRVHPPGDYIV